jgi:hypothetical protein
MPVPATVSGTEPSWIPHRARRYAGVVIVIPTIPKLTVVALERSSGRRRL